MLRVACRVYPMYKTFIEPDLKTAHLRIFNSFNPFSGLMNATYILKSAHPVTKQLIKAVLKVPVHLCTASLQPKLHTSTSRVLGAPHLVPRVGSPLNNTQ